MKTSLFAPVIFDPAVSPRWAAAIFVGSWPAAAPTPHTKSCPVIKSRKIKRRRKRHENKESSEHTRRKWLCSRERSGDVLRNTRQRSAAGAAARQSLDHRHLIRQGAAKACLDAADHRCRAAGTW